MIDESIKGLDLGGYKPTVAVPNLINDLTDGSRVATNESNIQGLQGQVNTHNGEIANLSNEVANKASVQYVDQKFNGASKAIAYDSYSTMITAFNALGDDIYAIGQDVLIQTLQVPDLWVSGIESASVQYTYVDDATFTSELNTNGYVQVGYYKLSALETQKVDLTDYQEKLTAGTNISIIDNIISASGGSNNAVTLGTETQEFEDSKTLIFKNSKLLYLRNQQYKEMSFYPNQGKIIIQAGLNRKVTLGIKSGSYGSLLVELPTSSGTLALTSDITAKVPDAPSTDGTYTLKCVVSNGTPTYQWGLDV